MALLPVVWIAIGLSAAMALAWLVQRMTGSSGWVDTIWSLAVGVGGIAAVFIPSGPPFGGRQLLVVAIIAVWSLRLGSHIAARTRGGGEDPRYAALQEQWGDSFSVRLFIFLQVQALAALALVVAVYAAATNPALFPGALDFLAVIVAVVAIGGEALADAQLAQFRRNNHGRTQVCETGLWRWSRHPNYFFEWLAWCAWPLLAIDLSGGHAWGWVALAAPVLMYVLLVHVSGIPPLEAHMLKSRGEAFRALQSRVNAFFPGPRHETHESTMRS
jgi:steroid 5-alpha reductase family enzyme